MVRTHVSPSQVAAGKAHERAKHGDGQLGAKPPNRPPLQRYYSCRTGKQAKQSKATPVRLRRPHAHGTEAESRVLPLASRRADGRRAVRGTLSDPRARERQARFGRASGPPPVRVKPPWRRAVRILFCFLPRRPHPFSSQ
jgi:hypothetical protein